MHDHDRDCPNHYSRDYGLEGGSEGAVKRGDKGEDEGGESKGVVSKDGEGVPPKISGRMWRIESPMRAPTANARRSCI